MDKQPTKRLYYEDCHLRTFEAQVVKSVPAGDRCKVYLDQTAFHPESGGQPSDQGTLSGVPVVEVLDEGAQIAHLVEHELSANVVQGEIDWRRRFDHMQQHTGQHLLSAAFEKVGGYRTVSFHLGSEVSTIDLDSDRLGRRQIEEGENLANRVVFENRVVRISFRPSGEAQQLALRKPTEREGEIRLVEIEDFDLSACGGTHVKCTGEIGLILVRKFERLRGSTRLEFVCGNRGLIAARRDFLVLSEAARQFSTSPSEVPALINKQAADLRAALKEQEKLIRRLAEYVAKELWLATPERNGRRVVRHIYPAEQSAEAKLVTHALAAQPACVALIAVKGNPSLLYFAQSAGLANDLGAILRQVLARFGGKGGGTRDFAQGGGLAASKVEEALATAMSLLA